MSYVKWVGISKFALCEWLTWCSDRDLWYQSDARFHKVYTVLSQTLACREAIRLALSLQCRLFWQNPCTVRWTQIVSSGSPVSWAMSRSQSVLSHLFACCSSRIGGVHCPAKFQAQRICSDIHRTSLDLMWKGRAVWYESGSSDSTICSSIDDWTIVGASLTGHRAAGTIWALSHTWSSASCIAST